MSDASAAAASSADATAEMIAQIHYFVNAFTMPVLVGTCISCLFAGLVTSLICRYFARYGKSDRWAFRILVAFYLVALLADTATQIAWTYSYAINGQLDPLNAYRLPREFMAFTAITACTVFTAQIFFNWRIWVISGRKNWLLCGAVCLLQLGAMGCGIYMFAAMAEEVWFPEFGNVRQAPFAWLGAGLGTDVLITAGMTYYLIIVPRLNGVNARRNQIVESPLRRLAIQTFQTNAVSLCLQTVTLAMMVHTIRDMNCFQEAKIYIASVVISLNARHTTGENSAHFSEPNPGATGRSKALGGYSSRFGRSTTGAGLVSQGQQQSVHVAVEQERRVDEIEPSVASARPYTVKFERVESDWNGGEKGDLELGRLEDVHLDEKL
ncbi:hypothetical protein RTBOTA2_006761 [Rhodotorula toruloides]|uniref:DUF6534 domain-containing protein n=1 Tax=Rhodotorula toruloides TaxID=5286 RepID=A0A2T0ACD2_RHOTO|nr:hypothetical protein RTBOTA2_006761 [Rhodotorula toruloides]PRQ75659.1 hypothetical protein AAT19DRAFT_13716 [Rhodotorula toruloides]